MTCFERTLLFDYLMGGAQAALVMYDTSNGTLQCNLQV